MNRAVPKALVRKFWALRCSSSWPLKRQSTPLGIGAAASQAPISLTLSSTQHARGDVGLNGQHAQAVDAVDLADLGPRHALDEIADRHQAVGAFATLRVSSWVIERSSSGKPRSDLDLLVAVVGAGRAPILTPRWSPAGPGCPDVEDVGGVAPRPARGRPRAATPMPGDRPAVLEVDQPADVALEVVADELRGAGQQLRRA